MAASAVAVAASAVAVAASPAPATLMAPLSSRWTSCTAVVCKINSEVVWEQARYLTAQRVQANPQQRRQADPQHQLQRYFHAQLQVYFYGLCRGESAIGPE